MSRVGGTLGAQPLLYMGLIAVLGVGPAFLASLADLDVPTFFFLGGILSGDNWLLSVIAASLLMTASLQVSHQQMETGQVDIRLALSAGARRILPFVGHSLLLMLALMLGFTLFTFPGLMIMCAFAVSLPSLVIEKRSVTNSFTRSRYLTRGSRWRIFALLLGFGVCWFLAGAALNSVPLPPSSFGVMLETIMSSLLSSMAWTLLSVLMAALFLELRLAREGPETDVLQDIFS